MGILDRFIKKEKAGKGSQPYVHNKDAHLSNEGEKFSADGVSRKRKSTTISVASKETRTNKDVFKKETVSGSNEAKIFIAPKAKQIVIRPLITEKATALGQENKYIFEVHPDTNKIEVRKEMQRLYNVHPIDVHMIHHRGKAVRYGRRSGRTKHWKKAIVTLSAGDHIETKVGT